MGPRRSHSLSAPVRALCLAAILAASLVPAYAGRENDPDAFVVNYFTGGGRDGVLFAAGTANQQCVATGLAQIELISKSPGVKLAISVGDFVVTGTDSGYLVCLGQRLPGTLVRGTGTGVAKIRVTYPPYGRWYEHTLTLPGR